MDVKALQREYLDYHASLLSEGFLDEQFAELQNLQDESSPNFVQEVVNLFFQDAERIITEIRISLAHEVVDFQRVDNFIHQLKGCSSSVGVQRVKNLCIVFRGFGEENNREECIRCLERIYREYFAAKCKLQSLFMLQHQIVQAGGRIP